MERNLIQTLIQKMGESTPSTQPPAPQQSEARAVNPSLIEVLLQKLGLKTPVKGLTPNVETTDRLNAIDAEDRGY